MTLSMTPWGYSIDGELPDVLTLAEYVAMGRAEKPATQQMLSAASQVVRDFCRWHVYPQIACEWTGEGSGKLVELPALSISSVTSVTETRNGTASALSDAQYEWSQQGMIRRAQFMEWPSEWRSVTVAYTAGYPSLVEAAKQVVAQLADNALAAPAGISSERAGNVELSYNSVGGMSGGMAIGAREATILAPYRIGRM